MGEYRTEKKKITITNDLSLQELVIRTKDLEYKFVIQDGKRIEDDKEVTEEGGGVYKTLYENGLELVSGFDRYSDLEKKQDNRQEYQQALMDAKSELDAAANSGSPKMSENDKTLYDKILGRIEKRAKTSNPA